MTSYIVHTIVWVTFTTAREATMFDKKEAHLYNQFGIEVQSIMTASAILTVPLSSFTHKEEYISGNARNLDELDIGKKFKVYFFDLYEFGTAEFIGFGLDVFPNDSIAKVQFYHHEELFSRWCVFKNSKDTIIVNPFHCDADPI